jgi:hypothetical protein
MGEEPQDWEGEESPWISIEELTEKQEEIVREMATELGFENLAGLAGYLESHDWDYYDVIKLSCRE